MGDLACGHDTGARDYTAETLQKEKQSEQIQENCTQCAHCKQFFFFFSCCIVQVVFAVIMQISPLWDQLRFSFPSFAIYSLPVFKIIRPSRPNPALLKLMDT